MTDRQRSEALLSIVDAILTTTGQAPISSRIMSVDLRDIGDKTISAALPTDTIKGSLAILLNRGKKVEAANASGQPTAGAASQSATKSTTTTSAP
jgi:hypothetical protein